MVRSDRVWKGILLSCWCILIPFNPVAESRRYDKCTTQDGRQGVCVVKRYCRDAANHPLLPCEGDEENHCCPIPGTQASDPPRVTEQSQEGGRLKPNHRPELAREPEEPKTHERPRTETGERDKQSSGSSSFPEKPKNHGRPRTEQEERDRHRPESSSSLDKPRIDERPRIEQDERDKRRPELPRTQEKPRNDERLKTELDKRERYHPELPREPERDDRLNKTPTPADRRSPTRNQAGRPKQADQGRPQAVAPDNGRRRPPETHTQPSPEDRHRPKTEGRPPTRPAEQDRRKPPVRRPDSDRFYPNREELDIHRNSNPPRRPKPEVKNNTFDSSKAPIRFPDTYEFSVPRPKVPDCGVKPYELFIAGGTESEKHEWPWMTAIFRRHPDNRPKTFLCGGSLINTKYVLTAAHCFVNNYVVLPASAFVVRLGSHFLDSGEEYTVSNLIIHHNHSGSDFFNDIALVRLASEVFITDKIAPVCLPYPEMLRDNLVGRMATVSGWGDTSFRSSGSRTLQHVTVPVVSGEECFAAYSRVRGAAFLARGSDHVICAGLREGGKDACLGDSGGPLMLKMNDDRWVVVGIVSLGYKCAEPGYPGVYTRVTHYMSWINTNMKKH